MADDDDLDRMTDAELYRLQVSTVHLERALAAGRLLRKRADRRAAERRAQVPRQRESR